MPRKGSPRAGNCRLHWGDQNMLTSDNLDRLPQAGFSLRSWDWGEDRIPRDDHGYWADDEDSHYDGRSAYAPSRQNRLAEPYGGTGAYGDEGEYGYGMRTDVEEDTGMETLTDMGAGTRMRAQAGDV
jgi:hypothetical protein